MIIHKSISEYTPIIIKESSNGIDYIDIKPITDVVNFNINSLCINNTEFQECNVDKDIYVWADNTWSKILHVSAYSHNIENKYVKLIETQNSIFMTTHSHKIIMENNDEKEISSLSLNDNIKLINYPLNILTDTIIKPIDAFLYGIVCRIGCASNQIYNELIYDNLNDIWEIYCNDNNLIFSKNSSLIEFYNNFNLHVNTSIFYDSYGKKIPNIIFNSNDIIIKHFLDGLFLQFNNVNLNKLNINLISKCQTLIAGICYLLDRLHINFILESDFREFGLSYEIELNSKTKLNYINKISKITPLHEYKGWFYNLTTDSNFFACGIGKGFVVD